MDLIDACECFGYFTRFWHFLGSAEYRRQCFGTWKAANPIKRLILAAEVAASLVCGLGPVLLLYYLIVAA